MWAGIKTVPHRDEVILLDKEHQIGHLVSGEKKLKEEVFRSPEAVRGSYQ